jgi:diketogulonate reductase-like aldo/keto reductase
MTARTRRSFLETAAGLGAAAALAPAAGRAGTGTTLTRAIPATGEVLEILFQAGGRVIDSSPMYGRAEEVVGELVTELRPEPRPFLATKVWTRGRRQGIEQMERSLSRLHTDRLDLMQVHNLVDWQIHLETLSQWKAAGRVRYVGVTHYTTGALDDLARMIETQAIDFVQLAYSIGVPDAARRVLPLAAERGVAVIVNRPYEGGSAFRAVKGRELPGWAAAFDCASWGQFFLKYILADPAVTCVIPGTRKPKHMADNVGAGFGRLPDGAERRRMEALWAEL